MSGLQRICKMYGGMTVGGIKMAWDYASDVAVPADDMPIGSDRWKASEQARWQGVAMKQGEPKDG